ncbi:GNAT family N-acetyltransferase [Promicromonospora kroppenstedtii]|uniref:GNAT family N-acetyltransferase n=1 Tax=Promicromonospora kroppenstedtii TaxID=440482 RepID=UPI0004BACB1E|nr:GNAT family N-acetyltransferase [Promicromonospora kroppenstedtii]
MSHQVTIDGTTIQTGRLRLRPWRADDAVAALTIYGEADVARWLAPAMGRIDEPGQMRSIVERWGAEHEVDTGRPTGRWAIDDLADGELIGSGQILGLPPEGEDLELGYQFAPSAWGRGLGSEAGHALAHYAFSHDEEEVFAVVRPGNDHGIRTAREIGMEWVGETTKYYDLKLQVFRLRRGDLDVPNP